MITAYKAPSLEAVWPRPTIAPKPSYVTGTADPVISLNTSAHMHWLFNSDVHAIAAVTASSTTASMWKEVIVPGELAMQGYDIENDTAYFYKTVLAIPNDYKDKTIILRFHGVYSKARVWVNGTFIREHQGGFTTWDCNITQQVVAGEAASLVVEFVDDIMDPSIGSKYAHHNIGGILRDVELIALPQVHLTRLHYEVDFDEKYVDAELKLMIGAQLAHTREADVQLELFDANLHSVSLEQHDIHFTDDRSELCLTLPVEQPHKWNAERPYLYTLRASLISEQLLLLEAVEIKVGFRKITYAGANGTDPREVYVNGERIKLRGTCRHSIHPELGRVTSAELDQQDVKMLREQNVNYVRTSHYPPTEAFLAACDELGMYVEEETAVNFQYANGPGPWRDDEVWYMNQLAEMIERDRSHPSVLIWSLANECGWRKNEEGNKFRRQLAYVRQEEPTRPTKFSYPFLVEDGSTTDIYSAHYAGYQDDMAHHLVSYGVSREDIVINESSPVIHDEYAHIACYNLNELMRDNNVRNFWGESILRFWERIVNTTGALGGALWANIDDIFLLPDGVPERHQQHSLGSAAGYGEWGNMSDIWRRPKPEFWLTKKAYSPVRLTEQPAGNPGDAPLMLSIKNWFNHTNLNDVSVHCEIYKEDSRIEAYTFQGPDVKPYEEGILTLPKRAWEDHERIRLSFQMQDGLIVDEYEIPITPPQFQYREEVGGKLMLEESDQRYRINNDRVTFIYDKHAAQLLEASFNGNALLSGGPQLHAAGIELGRWIPESIQAEIMDGGKHAIVTIVGHYNAGWRVQFVQTISETGTIETVYTLLDVQPEQPLQEFGLSFRLPAHLECVEWEKSGLYSAYPEHHIGRLRGRAKRVRADYDRCPDQYGVRPNWEWKDDMRNYYLEAKDNPRSGIVTNDFKTMREHIYYYQVGFESIKEWLRVESKGHEAARVRYELEQPQRVNDTDTSILTYTGEWSQGQDSKCYQGTETFSNQPGASASFEFYGTGVQLLYKKQSNTGSLLIQVDDHPAQLIAAHSDIGMPLYQQRIDIQDLPLGSHKLTVQVPEHNDGAYVIIDAFEILNNTVSPAVEAELIINQAWNYEGLSWGNYGGEAIEVHTGCAYSTTLRLTDSPVVSKRG